jgi:hypothetical protein
MGFRIINVFLTTARPRPLPLYGCKAALIVIDTLAKNDKVKKSRIKKNIKTRHKNLNIKYK